MPGGHIPQARCHRASELAALKAGLSKAHTPTSIPVPSLCATLGSSGFFLLH